MFKRYLLLSLLAATPLLADDCCESNWGLSADFLYFQPSFDDTYFVIDSPTGAGQPAGTRQNNDFDFCPGFRVGLGYASDWGPEFLVQYTWLGADQKKTVTGNNLWATQGSALFSNNLSSYTGSATSRLNFLYERIDGIALQQVSNCCGVDFSVSLGVEYAFLRLTENYVYNSTSPVRLGVVNQRSRAWGVGPELGFGIDYPFYFSSDCGSLRLRANTSGSLLAAKSSAYHRHSDTVNPPVNVSDEDTWRMIPALHAQVCLSYDIDFSCYRGMLQVGYEFNSYLRGLMRQSFPDDAGPGFTVSNYYNFDVQGLYVSASFGF